MGSCKGIGKAFVLPLDEQFPVGVDEQDPVVLPLDEQDPKPEHGVKYAEIPVDTV